MSRLLSRRPRSNPQSVRVPVTCVVRITAPEAEERQPGVREGATTREATHRCRR
jgi:hypothetical protein